MEEIEIKHRHSKFIDMILQCPVLPVERVVQDFKHKHNRGLHPDPPAYLRYLRTLCHTQTELCLLT